MIVIGFDGASTGNPDGLAYSSDYDWSTKIFQGDESLAQYYRDMSLGHFTFTPAVEKSAYGKDGNTNTPDKANDGEEIVSFMKDASVSDILKREDYWKADLTEMIPLVERYYALIEEKGMKEAYKEVLSEKEGY